MAAGCAVVLGDCFDGDEGPKFAGKRYPPRPIAGPPGHFHPSAVRAYWYFNEPYGQRREFHFLARGPHRTHVRQARECVEYYLDHD